MNNRNKKGQREGYWEYHCNDNLWYKGNYINGEYYGYWEIYNDNIKLAIKSFYL
jgi:hypothetical protein